MNTKLNPEYFAILLRGMKTFILSLTHESAHGTKVLATDVFENIKIPLLTTEEQKEIAEYIEKETARIDAKIAKTKRIIELQKEYRTALISEAVTGKIKIPDLTELDQ